MEHLTDETRAHDLAARLMSELGRRILGTPLQDLGWTFKLDNAKTRFGYCWYDTKVITFSAWMLHLNGFDYLDQTGVHVVDDVIRHEIAHAIDVEQRGTSDHSWKWRRVARLCGTRPTTYIHSDVTSPRGKFYIQCVCGYTYDFHRKTKYTHYNCRTCGRSCKVHPRPEVDIPDGVTKETLQSMLEMFNS